MSERLNAEHASRLLHLEEVLKSVCNQLNLSQLVCLLIIGRRSGLSVNELGEESGLPQQTASRHVSFLLGRYQIDSEESENDPFIVQQVNIEDPKKRALFLTQRGETLIRRMLQNGTKDTGRI